MSQRLNLFLVPPEPEFLPNAEAQHEFLDRLRREKLADVLGDVIGFGDRLVDGGATHIRLDIPATRVIWSNKSGGFQVSCPSCAEPLVREFNAAIAAWKRGEPDRTVYCQECSLSAPLELLRFRPKIGIGRVAIALRDVGSASITPLCRDIATQLLGEGFILVLSRG